MVRYISLELEEMHLSVKNLILDSVMSLPTSSFCSLKRSSSTSERLFFHLRSSLRRSRLALWITSLNMNIPYSDILNGINNIDIMGCWDAVLQRTE